MITMRGIDTPKTLARYRQRGSVLGIALIFLLLMTILGVSAMQGTTMQERMAGNQRDRDLAFQAAEAALRFGESWLNDPTPYSTPCGTLTHKEMADASALLTNPAAWNGTDDPDATDCNAVVTASGLIDDTAPATEIQITEEPKFYVGPPRQSRIGIELPATYRTIYPITARAVGATNSAVVILESMYEPKE